MQLYDHNNLERLYLKTLGNKHKTLAIMGCESGVGATTLATALAQRHLLAHHSVLYLELNSLAPSMSALCQLNQNESFDDTPMLITSQASDAVFTGIMAPQEKKQIINLREPQRLKAFIDHASENFDAVVIDCAPLCGPANHGDTLSIPADIIASVCDNSIVVIKGGQTKAPVLKQALALLEAQNVQPNAIAINQQNNPSLGQELIREAERITPYLPKLSRWISQKIQASLLMQPL